MPRGRPAAPTAGRPRTLARSPARRAPRPATPWWRGQRRPEVDRIRSARSLRPAASTSRGPAGPGAGSDGARSAEGRSCSGRRRGSRRGSSCCGDRPRSCRHSRERRRSCSSGNHVHRRGDPRTGLPRPASQAPSLLSFAGWHGDCSARRRSAGIGTTGLGHRSRKAKGCAEYRRGPRTIQGGGPGFARENSQISAGCRAPRAGCRRLLRCGRTRQSRAVSLDSIPPVTRYTARAPSSWIVARARRSGSASIGELRVGDE